MKYEAFVYTNFGGNISRNCINYHNVTEHDLGQVFVDVPSTPFSFGGRVRLHVG